MPLRIYGKVATKSGRNVVLMYSRATSQESWARLFSCLSKNFLIISSSHTISFIHSPSSKFLFSSYRLRVGQSKMSGVVTILNQRNMLVMQYQIILGEKSN